MSIYVQKIGKKTSSRETHAKKHAYFIHTRDHSWLHPITGLFTWSYRSSFYRVRHSHTCNTQVASCFSQPYCILRSKEIMLPWTKYPVIRFLNNGWFSFSWWMKRISELSKRNEALCCLHLFLHVLHVIWSLKTQKYQCRLLQYWKNIECQLPPLPPKVW